MQPAVPPKVRSAAALSREARGATQPPPTTASCNFSALTAAVPAFVAGLVAAGRRQPSVTSCQAARDSERPRRFLWTSLALSSALLLASQPASAERWDDYAYRYAPSAPPVKSKSGEAEIALAKHLKKSKVAIYCVWWSRECQELRELFGAEAAELAPFVDCGDKDRNYLVTVCPVTNGNVYMDKKRNGEYFPIWFINNNLYESQEEIALVESAKLTDFTEYPVSKLRTETDFEGTRYIWF
mmetsp:Transcript_3063/g.7087  ORF Transcript_3063/g.7087 Transcript_3063/m.7087 type:complete len:241 (+) Transcript_3063:54-776(+)